MQMIYQVDRVVLSGSSWIDDNARLVIHLADSVLYLCLQCSRAIFSATYAHDTQLIVYEIPKRPARGNHVRVESCRPSHLVDPALLCRAPIDAQEHQSLPAVPAVQTQY